MNKIKETVMTMYLATSYSFAFCWRNNKKATLARIVFSGINTITFYSIVQITGWLINSVQISKTEFFGKTNLYLQFLHSSMILPLALMFIVLIFGMLSGELNRRFRGNWMQSLRYADQREINNHRATFDVARFKSKEHDDLTKRIQELPNSWQTRIWFSEAMFNLFNTIISECKTCVISC